MRNPNYLIQGDRVSALCRDGIKRSAIITGHPETCFYLPAAVQVTVAGNRRTVAGYLSYDQGGTVCFRAYLYRSNHVFIPWTGHKPRLAKLALRLIKATAYGRGAPGYIWDSGADHAGALAGACRLMATGVSPCYLGYVAVAIIKRLPPEELPRLARFFDKQAGFIRFEESKPVPPPRDLPA
jgi:hypothetical protein